MDTVRLAYRDNERTPVIYCIKEMAAQQYDIDVEVLQIRDQDAYEACIFDGTADIIPEHLEYLFQWAAEGKKGTMFLCPSRKAEGELIVRPDIKELGDLRGQKIAVRTHGRPFATHMRMRALGLEDDVEFVLVDDSEVGRWQQWRTLLTGQCAATYVTCLYLPGALEAGLRLLPVPEYEVVGLYGHACSSAFAREHDDLMVRYVKAVTHAICLMKLRRAEAMEIVAKEPARLMRLEDNRAELEHRFDCISDILQIKGYPTPQGIANSHEIGCDEWPGGKDVNPMTLWDLHWLKRIDDEGFIDDLFAKLGAQS
jgi:ABC-type nitrate/sulfonate/bicarbonate transport system substrate-binding protein